MELSERVELLEEAESLLTQAIENIEIALRGTSELTHASYYIIPHLKTWIGVGDPYATSISDYIENLEKISDK